MSLQSIRHWQWIIISLLLGAGIGYLREQVGGNLADQYGSGINSQGRFEQALLASEQGRPCFTDISVHARDIPDGKGGVKHAYVVSGTYFNGEFERGNGKLLAKWHPSFFLAKVPYKPVTNVAAVATPEAAKQFQALSSPTVMDFLDLLSASRGIHYTHAWWLGMGMTQWIAASFIVIGVIWPIAFNLMVFGSWRRPPEEKGIDLSKVNAHAEAAKKPAMTEEDLAHLQALEAELEEKLGSAPPAPAMSATPAKAIRELATAPLEAGTPTAQDPDKEYRVKPDDFYPTERGKSAGKNVKA